MRIKLFGSLLAVGMLAAVGCEKAKEAEKATKDAVKDAAKDAEKTAKEAADKAAMDAKNLVVNPIKDMFPKFEEKIKAMTGATATGAKDKFDALKKLVEEFTNAPADKTAGLKEKLMTAFDELKKMVGL